MKYPERGRLPDFIYKTARLKKTPTLKKLNPVLIPI
jgi:hypothetical protein